MKKYSIILLLVIALSGCGTENKIDRESLALPENMEQGVSKDGEREASKETVAQDRVIEEQTFEVTLDDWGEVTFASIAPEEGSNGDVTFQLLKKGEKLYTFPGSEAEGFREVMAVAFQDYNGDGRKDVIAIVQYEDGGSAWNQARIFLQENPENTFYMDYDLEDYLQVQASEAGPAFYRDTLLEEYIQKNNLSDSIAAVVSAWPAYVEYAALLRGTAGQDGQIKIFAQQFDVWADAIEYADEMYSFALTDLDHDGRLELIVSNCGGTGAFSYNHFYQIDEAGELREMETNFIEGSSQVDIIVDETSVYSGSFAEGEAYYYIFGDFLKAAPDEYHEDIRALHIVNNAVEEVLLANKNTRYAGENYEAQVVCTDRNGTVITEEEYNNIADSYFKELDLQKKKTGFGWKDIRELQGKNQETIAAALRESYEQFAITP